MDKLDQQEINIEQDIILAPKPDRRRLAKVPYKLRTNVDRRRIKSKEDPDDISKLIESEKAGKRYLVDYDVTVQCISPDKKASYLVKGVDISTTGMSLEVSPDIAQELRQASAIKLKFTIAPGTMPEGYEMKVNIAARYIRISENADGNPLCGVEFLESLAQYATKKKNRYMVSTAAFFLFLTTVFIILMRAESVLYFKFNKIIYTYSIVAATFLITRYLFASFYRPTDIDPKFIPGVTIIIPCFNEEQWIQRTILSCMNQDYPSDKLEVIVVDDCSTDQSLKKIKEIVEELKVTVQHDDLEKRLHYVQQEKNAGKREALAKGTAMAQHELVVFVDSDSFLDPYAIRNIVQLFKDKNMGGVSGRTDVANTYTNTLTKMQAVRYYIAFRVMKAAESYFDAVTCLSGPLSCYRKDLLIKYMDEWLNQRFLGQKATFGDDRSMTNLILRENRTGYQDTAICNTIVPNTYNVFLKQQMRWKRSWLRESLIASGFMWRKEPFMALSFYMGVLVPLLAPIIVIFNLIYIPILHRVLPLHFIVGLCLMALLMSMAQLFLRRSSTWIYGFWFCLYYWAVLLWQMPIAWFTYWKTTWGTRMTPADLAAWLKRNPKKQKDA